VESGWRPFNGSGRKGRSAVDQAVHEETFCLAIVDVPQLVQQGQLAAVEKLLRHAHRRNRQGVLSLQTLQAVSEQFYDTPAASRSGGSILRAA